MGRVYMWYVYGNESKLPEYCKSVQCKINVSQNIKCICLSFKIKIMSRNKQSVIEI